MYFGELTFYPWSGDDRFEPGEFDFILGEKFNCNKKWYGIEVEAESN